MTITGEEMTVPNQGQRRAPDSDATLRRDVIAIQDMASGAIAAVSSFRADLACVLKGMDGMAEFTDDLVTQADEIEALVIAQAAEIRRLRGDLDAARDDAGRDALTGLPNRRAGETLLATGDGGVRSIAFVDIDRFKSVNDTYGHGFGDRILRLVASVLVEICGVGRVHRWGGEEFLVILDDLPAPFAATVMDTARMAVSGMEIRLRADDPPLAPITFSAGVSDASECDKAIAQADELLYFAKRNGRDQVVSFDRIGTETAFPAAQAA